jgi:replication-associated recombination protein RarA
MRLKSQEALAIITLLHRTLLFLNKPHAFADRQQHEQLLESVSDEETIVIIVIAQTCDPTE